MESCRHLRSYQRERPGPTDESRAKVLTGAEEEAEKEATSMGAIAEATPPTRQGQQASSWPRYGSKFRHGP